MWPSLVSIICDTLAKTLKTENGKKCDCCDTKYPNCVQFTSKKGNVYLHSKPHQRRCASQSGPSFSLGPAQAHAHRLWPASIQPPVAVVSHSLTVSTIIVHVNTWITIDLTTPEERKAELA